MKRLAVLTIILGFCLAVVPGAMALPFPITDVRALGMGGAFVAAGEGISAVQYNPVLLGKDSTVGVSLPEMVLRIEDNIGMVDLIDEFNDPGTIPTRKIAILNELEDAGSVNITGHGSVGAGFGAFGLSMGITYSDHISGVVFADNVTATLLTQEATVEFRGIDAKQIILSGAKSFGDFIIGGNVRNIDATTYSYSEDITADPDIGLSEITDGAEGSESALAVDAGLFMNLLPLVDVGVIAKDINGPKLGEIKFDPRYRIGVALNLPMITIAADYDVGENSVEDGTEYQEWAVGAEFDLWAIALRAGMSQNTGQSGAPTMLHLGVGLGFIDIGAAYAEEGDYYIAGANLSLGF